MYGLLCLQEELCLGKELKPTRNKRSIIRLWKRRCLLLSTSCAKDILVRIRNGCDSPFHVYIQMYCFLSVFREGIPRRIVGRGCLLRPCSHYGVLHSWTEDRKQSSCMLILRFLGKRGGMRHLTEPAYLFYFTVVAGVSRLGDLLLTLPFARCDYLKTQSVPRISTA